MQFDDIVKDIGGYGRYQKLIILLVTFPQILISIQALLPVFILSRHDYRCNTQMENSIHQPNNISTSEFQSIATLKTSRCSIQPFVNSTNITEMYPCTSWTFDKSDLISSPISDFNLVCDDAVLTQHASMAFMGGNLIGSFILGFVGDTWGRKIVMYIGAVLLFLSSLVCAWSVNFVMFIILRFLAGVATITCISSALIIAFEIVDPEHRSHVAVVVDLAWCVGEVLLSGAAYFLRDWRHLQIAVSSPGIILLLYWFLMPESARWLIANGRREKALGTITRASRVNKKRIQIDISKIKLDHQKSRNEIKPVFTSCTLLFRFAMVLFLWFVLALTYYGLTFNVGQISHKIYLDFLIYAVLEMVAYVTCLYVNTTFGRKPLNIGAFLLSGMACVSSTLVSIYAEGELGWLVIVLSALGRMAVSAVFANIFIYSGELFPTTIRSFILAFANVAARIGAVIAPYIAALGSNSVVSNTSLIFGILSLAAGLVSCLLPETVNTALPDQMADMKKEHFHYEHRPIRCQDIDSKTDVTIEEQKRVISSNVTTY
ncbi:organic cation transporter protein-like [Argopecten irradians]|uniref:organic cation transporter protein-like n=1 Tax=Argopecten irradians TaxID=31199 RepID=UPI00371B6555